MMPALPAVDLPAALAGAQCSACSAGPVADDIVTDQLSPPSGADEIDAIGTKRYESQSGGEREIQRTMLELLNQMDGFDSMGDVKVGRQKSFWQQQSSVRAPGTCPAHHMQCTINPHVPSYAQLWFMFATTKPSSSL